MTATTFKTCRESAGAEDPLDNAPKPVPFGKYELLERIAIGGMAEVFRARTLGAAGFEKYLAIKRILPHLSSDTDFVVMLIDEAKIAVNLNHANVVQVYDLGKVDGTYFIAMEFIEGADLRSVLHRALSRGRAIPIALAIYITMEVLKGLEYAHQKKVGPKEAAVDLRIIHRDMSPPNILISYEGEVKIVDFGIAKANTRMMETSAGVVKGKYEYMSPEQASGLELDSRTDLFSTGVCLYEAVTGRNPFTSPSDLQVLQNVRATRVPLASQVSGGIPPRLDHILKRALTRELDERFQRAADFRAELAALAYEEGLLATSSRLSAFMRELFATELAEGRLFVRAPEEVTRRPVRNLAPAELGFPEVVINNDFGDEGDEGPRTVVAPNPLAGLDLDVDISLTSKAPAALRQVRADKVEAPTQLKGGERPSNLATPAREAIKMASPPRTSAPEGRPRPQEDVSRRVAAPTRPTVESPRSGEMPRGGRSNAPAKENVSRATGERGSDPTFDLSADATFLSRPSPRKQPPASLLEIQLDEEPQTERRAKPAEERPAPPERISPPRPLTDMVIPPEMFETSDDLEVLQLTMSPQEPPILATGTEVVVPSIPMFNLSDHAPPVMGPAPSPLPTYAAPPPTHTSPPVRAEVTQLTPGSAIPVPAPLPPPPTPQVLQPPVLSADMLLPPQRRGLSPALTFVAGLLVGATLTALLTLSIQRGDNLPDVDPSRVNVTIQAAEGATLSVNGKVVGNSFPMTVTMMAGVSQQVRLEMPGFSPVERSLVPEAGRDQLLHFEFASAIPTSPPTQGESTP